METELHSLNEQFSIPGQLRFEPGCGGLTTAVIENQHASASMTLAGGHVMSYTPRGSQHSLLWVSPNSYCTIGKAMRGGVPVCWPWFGPHPTQPADKPMHGIARTQLWTVSGARALEDGSTEVRMTLRDTPETQALWPHAFALEVTATVGPRLTVEWAARNPGSQPYRYTGALHPYFQVGDAGGVTVHGLDGVSYLDKTDGFQRKTQAGPLRFEGEVDAIFTGTTSDLAIEDPALGRVIRIRKTGSRTTVVWNPAHKDASMPDVGEGQHVNFVCVESANAVEDVITVQPGSEGRLGMEIWCE